MPTLLRSYRRRKLSQSIEIRKSKIPMTEIELKHRTKVFALRVIKLVNSLSKELVARRLGDQLVRSGTSVAANYRSACRARSKADFVNKLGIVEEEADESALWMELLIESGFVPKARLEKLLQEAKELTAIMVASRKSTGGLRQTITGRNPERTSTA
jgi:four helix bundle protein